MAITDRSLRIHAWAQSCLGCLCALAASFAPWPFGNAESDAAPVTFRFAAVVDHITPLNGNAVPIAVELGDQVQAEMSFEPFDADTSSHNTNTIQELRAEFKIRSTLLRTETYFLRVSDNTPIDDAPPDETADHIVLGCSATGFVDCQPSAIPNNPMVCWDFSLSMFADGAILDGPDISDGAAVWNHFLPSSLVLTFRKTDGTDLALVAAGIESFVILPEPSTIILFLSSGVLLAYMRIPRTSRF
jgi:hypothetical protein